MRKRWILALAVLLFLGAAVVYTAAPQSTAKISFDQDLFKAIAIFASAALILGFLLGAAHFIGLPRKRLPDKGEFKIYCMNEFKEALMLLLCDLSSGSPDPVLYMVDKRSVLDKNGASFRSFKEEFPEEFIVMKRVVGEPEGGPAKTMYYVIPMNI